MPGARLSGSVHVLGVRHHGPGSARSVGAALDELQPDCVLVEGPPEGDPLIPFVGDEDLRPPVALLMYATDEADRSAFWPFAAFSPEWVALRHAVTRGVPARFIDLPAATVLAPGPRQRSGRHHDPLGTLAEVAGYDDPERWWEDAVEHRLDGVDRFDAVTDAMAALREDAGPAVGEEARREAHMRRAIRATLKEGFERIAVVCGAWHAPVLRPEAFPPAAHDTKLLTKLPRVKVTATWVPWTNERLAMASGYGAGVASPGWYAHLHGAADQPVTRWLQRVAAVLREEGIDASSASVIEAVRLAESLAALRGRPLAGLAEVSDSALAVLCEGRTLPLDLVHARLVVGNALGAVPDDAPTVPIARDLQRLQRSLRLKPDADAVERDLDLRKDLDLQRSHLLHRLALLGVDWGRPRRSFVQAQGTFREHWELRWRPELSVALIDAARWGTTVAAAADARARARAAEAEHVDALTGLVEACLLADLPDAVRGAMAAVAARAARDTDVGRLMDAVVPLARVGRYGSVRREDTAAVLAVVEGLVTRIAVGFATAVRSLDDEAARAMVDRVDALHAALDALDRSDLRLRWLDALAAASGASRDNQVRTLRPSLTLDVAGGLHGLVDGRITRLLLDAQRVEADAAGAQLSRALSPGTEPRDGAAWLEGFLGASGTVLLHDPALLALVDDWVGQVPPETFDDLLPLLRRTFSTFPAGERRRLGERVKRGPAARGGGDGRDDDALDPERVALVRPVLEAILG